VAAQREWFEKDYYQLLGVSQTATPKEITKAYRKLARDLHPDRRPDDPEAAERFKEVSAAYEVLGDEAKRAEYDEVRRLGPQGAPGGFGGRRGPGGFRFNVNDVRDGAGDGGAFSDLFGQMFGQRDGAAPSGVGPRRGEDLRAELSMDFADAAFGLSTTLHLTSEAQCSVCHGSGARPPSTPKICPTCGGRGVIDDNQGLFSFSSPCPRCHGAGTIIEDPCPACRGTGIELRPRQVQARIPAGVKDGQTIRLKGRGGPGFNGGPPGDLYVEVHVRPDEHFGRNGLDLTVSVEIDFWQAALGDVIGVPTLRGPDVTLRVKPGTQSGSRHRVKGRGIKTTKDTGDLIVTIDVAVPRHLTKEQRAAVEALRAASTADQADASNTGGVPV